MIEAVITKHNGEYKSFSCEGHAGFARKGKDIVCASVSVLTINTCNSIEALTDTKVIAQMKDGYLSFELAEGCDDKASLLMDSMILGLEQISKDYKSLLRLVMKEV